MIAATQLETLRRRLGEPLPGNDAHERMMPVTRKAIYREIVIPETAKKSAVLFLFYPSENGLLFPLIERTEYPGVHSRQIGLPGGACEPEDADFVETALRETEEEIGVGRHQVEVLGLLSSLYIPPSNFWVQPVIGYMSKTPAFVPDPNEVASVIPVHLHELVGGTLVGESKVQHSSGAQFTVPSYTVQGHVVWGATAMMISELVALMND